MKKEKIVEVKQEYDLLYGMVASMITASLPFLIVLYFKGLTMFIQYLF